MKFQLKLIRNTQVRLHLFLMAEAQLYHLLKLFQCAELDILILLLIFSVMEYCENLQKSMTLNELHPFVSAFVAAALGAGVFGT